MMSSVIFGGSFVVRRMRVEVGSLVAFSSLLMYNNLTNFMVLLRCTLSSRVAPDRRSHVFPESIDQTSDFQTPRKVDR